MSTEFKVGDRVRVTGRHDYLDLAPIGSEHVIRDINNGIPPIQLNVLNLGSRGGHLWIDPGVIEKVGPKVGDRIRIIRDSWWSDEIPTGTETVITEVFSTTVRTGLWYRSKCDTPNLHLEFSAFEVIPPLELKVGDRVITRRFSPPRPYGFTESMKDLVGIEGVVERVTVHGAVVHDWYWPSSALTPVAAPIEEPTPIEEPITLDGEYETRSGIPVRILAIDLPGKYPVVAAVGLDDEDDSVDIHRYSSLGQFFVYDGESEVDDWDLIKKQPKPPEPLVCYTYYTDGQKDPWGSAFGSVAELEREGYWHGPESRVVRLVEDTTYTQP